MIRQKHHLGFTLIEIIIVLTLLVVLLMGGTTLFYQNLKSSGLSDVDLNINGTMREILSAMEKDIRFGNAVGIGSNTRLDCLGAGSTGITGDNLKINDISGGEITYFLDNDKVASESGVTGTTTYLNESAPIKADSLSFTWTCQGGLNDKIKIELSASSSVLGSGLSVNRSVSQEIILLNTGI